MKTKKFINLSKLIDPWSVPHFLFGVVMAVAVIVFMLPVLATFFATFVIALLWEQLERYSKLREAPGNSGIDVLLSLMAFTITFALMVGANISQEQGQALLIVSFLLYIYVNFFAWRARFEHDRDFRG